MADYPKDYGTNAYPVHSTETSGLIKRIEPLLTPEKLISRFLKGIDLSDYTEDELKDKIMLAFNEAETLIGTTIYPEKRKEKHPFDMNLYKHFIHINSNVSPILRLDKLSIQSSNNINIFEIPADWIEAARFFQGQLNVIPLTVVGATGISSGQPTGAAGLAFIAAMNGGIKWVPSYWEIEYVSGLCHKEGSVPVVINEIIGAIAAIEILGPKGAADTTTSVSISHDGVSQSSSNPGPNRYKPRIEELAAKRDEQVRKIKKLFHNKYFLSNI